MTFAPNTRATWTSTEQASKGPLPVRVIGPTDPEKFDLEEVGPMHDIELPDGSVYNAFEDELSVP